MIFTSSYLKPQVQFPTNELVLASVFPALGCLLEFCWGLLCSSPVSRALISEGIFPWSIAMHHCLYISSSSRSAHIALSRLDTNSSKYWYLSFFLARHSLALCRLRSSFAFKSILAGFRPRLPGFFTLPPTTSTRPAWDQVSQHSSLEGRGVHEAFPQPRNYWQSTSSIDEQESHFSLGVCLLLRYPGSSGWLHSHVHAGSASQTQ